MGFISYAKKNPGYTFHPKNPALQDSILVFNQDCELVSQLPNLSYRRLRNSINVAFLVIRAHVFPIYAVHEFRNSLICLTVTALVLSHKKSCET